MPKDKKRHRGPLRLSERVKEKVDKKGKSFLMYTILLFSITFILILFSSFTGIRYKDAQYEKSKLFHGAQMSVVALTEENNELKNENEKLLAKMEEKNVGEKEERAKTEEYIKNTDTLMEVQNLYTNRSYTEAAILIQSVNRELLSESGKKLYDHLDSRLH